MMRQLHLAVVLFAAAFFTLQEFIVRKTGISAASVIDEALLLLFFGYSLVVGRHDRIVLACLALPVISLVHGLYVNYALFEEVRTKAVVLQSLINFKYFIFFAYLYTLRKTHQVEQRFFRVALILVFAISMVGYLLNMLSPSTFAFSDSIWHLQRQRISGFQFKPNDLAIFLALFFVFALETLRGEVARPVLLGALIALVYLTTSRTAFIVIIFGLLFSRNIRHKNVLVFAAMASLIFFSLYFWDRISNSYFVTETLANIGEVFNAQDSEYIRGIIIYYGVTLSLLYPFGLGAASYGSVMSTDSPIYFMIGIHNNHFVVNELGIYDSNLASILAEYGIVGAASIIWVFYKTLKYGAQPGGRSHVTLFSAGLALCLVQPFFAYHINSFGFLLLVFSLLYDSKAEATRAVVDAQQLYDLSRRPNSATYPKAQSST